MERRSNDEIYILTPPQALKIKAPHVTWVAFLHAQYHVSNYPGHRNSSEDNVQTQIHRKTLCFLEYNTK